MPRTASKVLTAAAVDRLKVGADGATVAVADAGQPGLYVLVSATGKRWQLRLNQDGKRIKKVLGQYPTMSLSEARKAVEAAKDRRASGEAVIEAQKLEGIGDRNKKRQLLTVADGWERYYRDHVEPNLAKPEKIQKDWDRYLAPLVNGAVMSRLSRGDVMAVLDELNRTKTPSVAAASARQLRGFLNWCGDRELCEPGIASRLKIKAQPARDRVLSIAEVKQVLSAADSMGVRPGAVVRLLWLTMCRANEIAHLEWDEVQGRELVLSASRMKGGRVHRVQLPEAAQNILKSARELSRGTRFVFPASTTKIDEHGFADGDVKPYDSSNLPAQLRRHTGLPHFVVHDLRRTGASLLAERGVSQETIKLCLGHAAGQVFSGATSHYVMPEAYREQCREALEMLAEMVR